MHCVQHSQEQHASSIPTKKVLWQLDILKHVKPQTPTCFGFSLTSVTVWPRCNDIQHVVSKLFKMPKNFQISHKPSRCSLATKQKWRSSFLALDLREPTFCHAPRVLATSDLLAVHLNHHVAADYCQGHFLLEWEDIHISVTTNRSCNIWMEPLLSFIGCFLWPLY